MDAAESIGERKYLGRSGFAYEYVRLEETAPDLTALLSEQDRKVLDRVVDDWSSKALGDVLKYVYANLPYAGTAFGDRVPMENA